jgi:hypothetical protein
MRKNWSHTDFDTDRDDRLTSLTVAALVFTGGILSLLVLGAIAVNIIDSIL